MKTASGIGWPTPKAEVNQYLTRSSWSWVDRNQKSIIVLLNYQEFPSQKLITSDAITAFLSRPAVISLTWLKIETPNTQLNTERSQRKAF